MGIPTPPSDALLFIGVLYSKEEYLISAKDLLEKRFGEIIMESPIIKWDFSEYYQDELGKPIYRKFLFFKRCIPQDELSSVKLATNEIEKKLSHDGKRNINLDPGYMTPAKIVLASTKDYSHRIYLRDGIYAEVTLIYKNGKFIPHINTYKDYQDETYHQIFSMARRLFRFISLD